MNVPQLRFDGFDGEWASYKLGNLTELTDGTHYTPNYQESGVPFWSVETITVGAKPKFISKEAHLENIKRCKPEFNDILVTRISSGINSLGMPKLVNWNEEFSIYVSVGLIKSSSKFHSEFLSHYISSPFYKTEFRSKSLLTATPKKINMIDFKNTKVKLPDLEEQRKIATFFTLITKKIEKQQEKIEKLEQFKKGMMQNVFSQELRFKNEDGVEFPEWEQVNLGEVVKIETGNKDTNNKIEDGTYPFFVRSQTIERINSYSFDGEAILTAGDGVGVGKVFHYIDGKFDYHQRVYKLSDFKHSVGKYIFYYFKENFLKEAMKYNAKTSVDSVRRDMIVKMLLPLPSVPEQRKIADYFSAIDKNIEKEKEKLMVLEEQKRGFMRGMFV